MSPQIVRRVIEWDNVFIVRQKLISEKRASFDVEKKTVWKKFPYETWWSMEDQMCH